MSQMKIRDFGEKILFLVGTRGAADVLDEMGENVPEQFPKFGSMAQFASSIGVDQAGSQSVAKRRSASWISFGAAKGDRR